MRWVRRVESPLEAHICLTITVQSRNIRPAWILQNGQRAILGMQILCGVARSSKTVQKAQTGSAFVRIENYFANDCPARQ